MTCRAARVYQEDEGVHQLSFSAVTPEEAAQGYCAKCDICGSRFKSSLEYIITPCTARPTTIGRGAEGQ